MTFPIRLVDRSRITRDWTCQRARFYNYEYQGKGITRSTTSLPLALGIAAHDSLATIATMHRDQDGVVDIDAIADNARVSVMTSLMEANEGEEGSQDFACEQAALVEGQIRGFYKYVWPRLISQYPNIIAIEQEMEYKLSDSITFMSKPDLILGDSNDDWTYIEYKTTSSKSVDWINSWNTAVQVHSTIKAVESTLGKAPTSVIVQGLYKGYKSYNKQNSPFCYAYKRTGNPPFTKDEVQYDYKAGFKKYPTWELPGGTKGWVDEMPDEVLADLFPQTPPMYIDETLVDAFFKQVESREINIMMAMNELSKGDDFITKEVMDSYFPQKFSECSPAYGFGCEFKELCFGHGQDPLETGFQFREPHHAQEVEQWQEQ